MNTATAMEPSTVLQVEKQAMVRALHAQSNLAEVFMAFLIKRSINLGEDLPTSFSTIARSGWRGFS